MFLRNMELLILGITRKLDHLHTIKQRSGDRICPIGGTNEKCFGKIKRKLQIVIGEMLILLRIQNL